MHPKRHQNDTKTTPKCCFAGICSFRLVLFDLVWWLSMVSLTCGTVHDIKAFCLLWLAQVAACCCPVWYCSFRLGLFFSSWSLSMAPLTRGTVHDIKTSCRLWLAQVAACCWTWCMTSNHNLDATSGAHSLKSVVA